MLLRRTYGFEASHVLPRHPGRCRNLHGHSYRFTVEVEGEIDPEQGMVIDFGELDAVVTERVLKRLDHAHLNDVLENPTAEWIAVHLWRELRPALPGLRAVELYETEGAAVVYRGELEGGADR
ncbi:MAG: 6-carboxytetrahydropterin synthase QueD [Acidobacteria bacterium]|nr:MAG: 6-carboxytetrahydropterin synthase QueD [Acidobacteriota bacterium]